MNHFPFGYQNATQDESLSYLAITGQRLWLDASDASTLTDVGSGNISQIRDKSGNNNHANVSGLSYAVATPNVQNSKAVLRGGPSDGLYNLTNIALPNDFTVFAVVSRRVVTGTRMYIGTSTGDQKLGQVVSGTARHFTRIVQGGSSDSILNFPFAQDVFGIIKISRDSSNKIDYATNNNANQRLFADAAQTGTFQISRVFNDNTGSATWDGDIAEIRVYDRLLSVAEQNIIIKNLNGNWALY